MKKLRNQIDGVLLLDKPSGLSSNQAIQKVKYLLNATKVGHTGTLDPLATGLLPVCLGEATKFAGYLLDGDKEYIATAQLGVVTDSGDSEGNILATNLVETNLSLINAVFSKFSGPITQIPPMYCALKYNGRPLYEYARRGIEIERKPRDVVIHDLELLKYDSVLFQLTFRAKVSKGTYIRTLAMDIGDQLGSGASLIALQRTKANQFCLQNACSLADLEQFSSVNQLSGLLPIEVLCGEIPLLSVDQDQYEGLKYGNPVIFGQLPANLNCEEDLRLFAGNKFLGIAQFKIKNDKLWLCPKRMVSGLSAYEYMNLFSSTN